MTRGHREEGSPAQGAGFRLPDPAAQGKGVTRDGTHPPARRLHSVGGPDTGEEPAADGVADDGAAGGATGHRGEGHVCAACPVGIVMGGLQEASPEALDHLLAATRSAVSAMRALLEGVETHLDSSAARTRVERIRVD